MKIETMRVRLTFIDSILGGEPNDKELHATYIQGQIPDDRYTPEELEAIKAEEIDALMEGDPKGRTVFYRDADGNPCLKNNHILGFFKSACGALRNNPGSLSGKVTAYKREIDNMIKVFENADDKANRFIRIQNAGEVGSCQRPLRAQTAQGERVAIADSDEIGAGAFVEFDVVMLKHSKKPIGRELIEEWLDYGIFSGLGQWRNSGHGAFTYEVIE